MELEDLSPMEVEIKRTLERNTVMCEFMNSASLYANVQYSTFLRGLQSCFGKMVAWRRITYHFQ